MTSSVNKLRQVFTLKFTEVIRKVHAFVERARYRQKAKVRDGGREIQTSLFVFVRERGHI